MNAAAILAAILGASPAQAAGLDAAPVGDIARGAEVAAPCAACHGQHGEGLAAGGFPRLAGQPAGYLAKQLRDFVDGSRDSAVMQPLAKTLSEQAIADVSAYYGGLATPATTIDRAQDSPAGRQLANIGDEKTGVQACGNCHGPNGRGEAPTPYLAGQHATYLAAQIEAWQKGTRHNDGGDQMTSIAKRLNAAEIAAVAAHFAQQSPPNP